MDTADSSEREAETVALEADAESGTAQHPVGSIGKYRIHREIGRGGMGTV
ncbi:MAG: hypothetical protein IH936_13190, partial [Acidobacteria bacterium]|nr:hypothetical protein [Acidobacteriota bacterium]